MPGMDFIRRSRQGLSPASHVARRFGYRGPPRFAGVALSAPDDVSAWGIAYQIASGEYSFPGLEPQRGRDVVDIGANVGIYALWASRRGATVTSYEPSPATYGHLLANTQGRGITPVQAAVVGSVPDRGTARLYLHDARSTRNTLLGREMRSGEELREHVDVPAVSIDDVLADECDLLKIDCEGEEFGIFAGVSDNALGRARRIVLEFHRVAGEPAALLERLRASGFRARILAGENPAEPVGMIGAYGPEGEAAA